MGAFLHVCLAGSRDSSTLSLELFLGSFSGLKGLGFRSLHRASSQILQKPQSRQAAKAPESQQGIKQSMGWMLVVGQGRPQEADLPTW